MIQYVFIKDSRPRERKRLRDYEYIEDVEFEEIETKSKDNEETKRNN